MTLKFARLACMVATLLLVGLVAPQAQTYKMLTGFNPSFGENPLGPLVQGVDGNLYGVAETGGNTNSICPPTEGLIGAGCGAIFKVSPAGQLTMLYEFCSVSDCTDGAQPVGSLTLASNGNFYGVTLLGGNNNQGTVFKITPAGQLTTLYSFCSKANCADGASPVGGLVQGLNGSIFGVTTFGGAFNDSSCALAYHEVGCGTLFEISPADQLTTLYSFCAQSDCADGSVPEAGLTLGSDGNLYGTTFGGGSSTVATCPQQGCGTVFRLSAFGHLSTIHTFCSLSSCRDGQNPSIGLTQAANGKLYGLASTSFFSINASGKLISGFQGRGLLSTNGLMQATDGNLYGTQFSGGTNNNCSEASACGSIIRLATGTGLSTLYSFCPETGCPDGASPATGVMQATNGILYGTTLFGGPGADQGYTAHGNGGCGVVFSMSLNLSPFVQTVFNFAKVGGTVGILGNNLAGATNVTFNGATAAFTVVSSTFIKAIVPSGATTGTIQVKTPSGTLSSNVQFHVVQ